MSGDRLEAMARGVEFDEGVQARIADPLWLLGKQWQVGEFRGDDAAQPSAVSVSASVARLGTFQAGDAAPVEALQDDQPLESLVERAPLETAGLAGLGTTAVAGERLAGRLRRSGLGDAVAALRAAYPIKLDDGVLDVAGPDAAAVRLLIRRGFDGLSVVADLGALARFDAFSPQAVQQINDVIETWAVDYYNEASGTWRSERFEHSFSVAAPVGSDEVVLKADEHRGGQLDWYSFDIVEGAHGGPGRRPETLRSGLLPTPVRFNGMPASRWWEFEDGSVHFGDLDAGPTDLARLSVAEFATVYSDDWFVAPVRVPRGAVVRVDELTVFDTFGGRRSIEPASLVDAKRLPSARPWRLFELTGDPHVIEKRAPWLFVPPVVATTLEGPALERVVLARDEGANLAWGIERQVEGPLGRAVDRARAWSETRDPQARSEEDEAEASGRSNRRAGDEIWTYRLEDSAPPWWIPFVAERLTPGSAEVGLRRARMATWDDVDEGWVGAHGSLLEPFRPLVVFEEEVPRSGTIVERSWQWTRWHDGTAHLWIQRRKRNGLGERSSGLRWDLLQPTPRPGADQPPTRQPGLGLNRPKPLG